MSLILRAYWLNLSQIRLALPLGSPELTTWGSVVKRLMQSWKISEVIWCNLLLSPDAQKPGKAAWWGREPTGWRSEHGGSSPGLAQILSCRALSLSCPVSRLQCPPVTGELWLQWRGLGRMRKPLCTRHGPPHAFFRHSPATTPLPPCPAQTHCCNQVQEINYKECDFPGSPRGGHPASWRRGR